MANPIIKWLCTYGLFMLTVMVGLSLFLGVPYAYSILGFAVWMFCGHLITIDDDMPGGFSNPEGSGKFWRRSQAELGIKFVVLVILGALVFVFPVLQEFGAK